MITKFETDWVAMIHLIKGQMCLETLQGLMQSDDWQSIADDHYPGRLMQLLQILCLYGSDKAYAPEMVFNALKECMTRKQSNNSPTEFSELIGTNMDVLNLCGTGS